MGLQILYISFTTLGLTGPGSWPPQYRLSSSCTPSSPGPDFFFTWWFCFLLEGASPSIFLPHALPPMLRTAAASSFQNYERIHFLYRWLLHTQLVVLYYNNPRQLEPYSFIDFRNICWASTIYQALLKTRRNTEKKKKKQEQINSVYSSLVEDDI